MDWNTILPWKKFQRTHLNTTNTLNEHEDYMMDANLFLWEAKYKPKTIEECILPKELNATFTKIVKDQNISNYLFESTNPGTGKTTCALALCNEIGADTLFLNASEVGSIDTLRNDIKAFASTVSLTGSLKVVILDEFDNVSDTFQKAFRGFIEEYSSNCRFILTCNYANNIIEPIRSRMKRITFIIPDEERIDIMKQMTIRCLGILKKENVLCESPKIVGELVKRNYPDNRKTIIELQHYATNSNGTIDEGILGVLKTDDTIGVLIQSMQKKDFKTMNQMIPRFATDYANFIRSLYDKCFPLVQCASIPTLIEIIGENQKFASMVPDMEIHIRYLCVQMMAEIIWKN